VKKLAPCSVDGANQYAYWASRSGEQRKPVIEQRQLRKRLLDHQRRCPLCKERYKK
jgi:hypothetical protein